MEVYSRIQQKGSIIKEEFEEKYINNGSIIDENKAPLVLMSLYFREKSYKKGIYQFRSRESIEDKENSDKNRTRTKFELSKNLKTNKNHGFH